MYLKKISYIIKQANLLNQKRYLKSIIILLLLFIYVISTTVYPNYIHKIIDYGVIPKNINLFIINSILMVVVGVTMLMSEFFYNFLIGKAFVEIQNSLKLEIFNRMFDINKTKKFSYGRVGEISTILTGDTCSISELITHISLSLLKDFLTFIGVLIYTTMYFEKQSLIIIILSIVMVVIQRVLGRSIQRTSEENRDSIGSESSQLHEFVNNIDDIKLSGNSEYVICEFKNINEKVVKTGIKHEFIINITKLISHSINVLLVITVIIFGSIKIFYGNMEIGMLFALTIYAQRLIGPISGIMGALISYQDLKPMIDRVYDLVKDTESNCSGLIPEEALKSIEYDNVSLSYDNETDVISKFKLKVNENDKIAIIGGNGTGKTTITKAIFDDKLISKGSIILNNRYNLKDIKNQYIYNNIGYLSQETSLISGKVRHIINPYEREDITDADIFKILNELGFNLASINNDLAYEIRENSKNISGGEKQKLGLARIILENKNVLILDEPTSAMDIESEQKISAYLKTIFENKTVILITHRRKIIDICDRVVVL